MREHGDTFIYMTRLSSEVGSYENALLKGEDFSFFLIILTIFVFIF